MRVVSASEFNTQSAFLSLAVTSAGARRSRSSRKSRRGGGASRRDDPFADSDDDSASGASDDGGASSDEASDDDASFDSEFSDGDGGVRTAGDGAEDGSASARKKSPREETVIELVCVHPKSIQECTIKYEDAVQFMSLGQVKVEPQQEEEETAVQIKQEPRDDVEEEEEQIPTTVRIKIYPLWQNIFATLPHKSCLCTFSYMKQ